MPPRRPRPAALVRAEHDPPPPHLAPRERALLQEALRNAEDLRGEVEAKVAAFGRWLLAEVFGNDAASALDEKSQNPVWLELLRRAGGPTLRISRRMLYVSVAIAARDRRIADAAWRGLDAGRKELLLPLGEDARVREAAQHVAKFNLTQPKTRAYVTELMRAGGKPRQVRLTAPRLLANTKELRSRLERPAVLRGLAELRRGLEPAQRDELVGELDRLREVLATIAKTLRARG